MFEKKLIEELLGIPKPWRIDELVTLGLPEPTGAPSPEAIQARAETASQYGIEFVGPPLTEIS
jgi:hypothetical protein